MRTIILVILALLCLFTALSFTKSGEVLAVMTGDVQKCEFLGAAPQRNYLMPQLNLKMAATLLPVSGTAARGQR